jgi:uncharacterized protein YkwD
MLRFILSLSLAVLVLIVERPAMARHPRRVTARQVYAQPVYAAPQQVQAVPQAPATMTTADPHGVVAWANAVRAQYGLHALIADPTLSAWAQTNSIQQASRGVSGHYTNPGYFQISYYGPATAQAAVYGWLVPSHMGVLLSRTARIAGGAGYGVSWTLNIF